MKVRVAIPALVAALALLLGWAAFRNVRAPEAPPPPAALKPTIRVRPAPAPEPVTPASTFRHRSALLREATTAALKSGGGSAAYRLLRERIDAVPKSDEERRDRAFAIRCLPAIARSEPALREEILALLREHLTSDADSWARIASAACLTDAPLHFMSVEGLPEGFWSDGSTVPEGSDAPDESRLEAGAAGREALRSAYGAERDDLARVTLLQLLSTSAGAADRAFFAQVLEGDAHVEARGLALEVLGRLPWTPELRASLERTLQGAPPPLLREKALGLLIGKGVADDLVVATLLATPPATHETWQQIGQAWALTQAPPLGAFLRAALDAADAPQRIEALTSIARSGDKGFLPFVEAAFAREQDARARQVFALVLDQLKAKP